MSNLDVVDPADEERTYRAKPYRDRLGVAVAGSTMHFLIAFLLLLAVYALVGIPAARPVIQQIVPDSPAQHSDFRVGDRIVAVNGVTVKSWEDIPTYVQSHGESDLVFTVIHKGTHAADQGRAQAPGRDRRREAGPPGGDRPRAVSPDQAAPVGRGHHRHRHAQVHVGRRSRPSAGIFSPNGIANYGHLLQGKGGNQNNRLLSPGRGRPAWPARPSTTAGARS